jgi:hypothetical protein
MGFSDNTAVTYYRVGQARFGPLDGDTHGVDLYLAGEDTGSGRGNSSGHFTMFEKTARQLGAWLIQQALVAEARNARKSAPESKPDAEAEHGERVITLGFNSAEKERMVRCACEAGFHGLPSDSRDDVIVRWLHALASAT